MLSFAVFKCCGECRIFIVMLSVIMLSVVVSLLIRFNVIMLSVVMPNAIMVSVVAPFWARWQLCGWFYKSFLRCKLTPWLHN
jgi:hypothetical protein